MMSRPDFQRLFEASYIEWGLLVVTVSLMVWLIFRVRAWFREEEDPTELDREILLQFKDLHRQGDLTDEEFRSIKGRMRTESETPPFGGTNKD